MNYKYYSGLTSQLAFCSTPLRLDAYNNCQFSCGYCFAATRQGHGRKNSLQISDPNILEKKLKRIFAGNIKSSLDECIANRVPFQLGGMSDPFSPIEKKRKVSLRYLQILADFNYPVIISTKSSLISEPEYLKVLSRSNAYVRFSTTVIDEMWRYEVDKGTPLINQILYSSEKISNLGIPVSFRFQPIIPGFENELERMVKSVSNAGAKHISLEYLKVPLDANQNFSQSLKNILCKNPIDFYIQLGAKKQGREYILPLKVRQPWLLSAFDLIKKENIRVGFADNDLLLHSDGNSCCNSSDEFLKGAGYFDANIASLLKSKDINQFIFFDEFLKRFIPKFDVSSHMNSKARLNEAHGLDYNWLVYLDNIWRGHLGIFKPSFFDGVEHTDELDSKGRPVYVRRLSEFEEALQALKKQGNDKCVA